jgi:hypothetical protein
MHLSVCSSIYDKATALKVELHQFNHQVEFRVVLLHVLRAVLLSGLLDHRFHSFGIGHGIGDVCLSRASCPYLEHRRPDQREPPTLAAI